MMSFISLKISAIYWNIGKISYIVATLVSEAVAKISAQKVRFRKIKCGKVEVINLTNLVATIVSNKHFVLG